MKILSPAAIDESNTQTIKIPHRLVFIDTKIGAYLCSDEPFTFKQLASFVGPAFFVSVGYLDPGNCMQQSHSTLILLSYTI